jgi:hypothetical protein
LEARFKNGNIRFVDVSTEADYRYVIYGADVGRVAHLKATMLEGVVGLDPLTKLQNVQYKFEEVAFGEPRSLTDVLRILLTVLRGPDVLLQIKNVVSQATFTKDGVMTKAVADLSQVPARYAGLYKQFNDQVLQAIQVMSIKFPNRKVEYGETWEQPTNLLIATRNRHEPALFLLTMKYMGVRDRGGRPEAVIEIRGTVANDPNAKSIDLPSLRTGGDDGKDSPKDGKPDQFQSKQAPKANPKSEPKAAPAQPAQKTNKPLYGAVRGYAFIDVETGTVAQCQLFLDVDVEILHKDKQTNTDVPVRAGGTIAMKMIRRTSN